ncbi:MAG: hypothetical protein ACYSU1_06125, partial [Planctomycetota bacterium]
AVAVPWMAQFRRELRPDRVGWQQDDVVHHRSYWLYKPEPQPRCRVVVAREGNIITIEDAKDLSSLVLRLDETMVDFAQEVVVRHGEQELFRGMVSRDLDVQRRTLKERGDPKGMWSAEVVVELGE